MDITSNRQGRALVSAVICLAHELGLHVVAEGVEDKEQLDILTRMDCDEYKGYFFSRPVGVLDLTAILSEPSVGVKTSAAGRAVAKPTSKMRGSTMLAIWAAEPTEIVRLRSILFFSATVTATM